MIQQSNCYPNMMKIEPFEFLRGLAAATVLTITIMKKRNEVMYQLTT